MTWILQVAAALGGLTFFGGIITALAVWRKSKSEAKKTDIDAASVLTDSALKIVKDLRTELRETRTEMHALREHMGTLEDLLRQRGVPVPQFRWPPQRNGVS